MARYNAAHPEQRRAWLAHSRGDVTCRRCGDPVGPPELVDDGGAWALGYHVDCWTDERTEREQTWQDERRAEIAMRELRRQRRLIRIGRADLVRAAKLIAERTGQRPNGRPRGQTSSLGPSPSPAAASRRGKTSPS